MFAFVGAAYHGLDMTPEFQKATVDKLDALVTFSPNPSFSIVNAVTSNPHLYVQDVKKKEKTTTARKYTPRYRQ
jgi:hypothetical protein